MGQSSLHETLAQAIESGEQLRILYAQRREIAIALDGEKGQALATLHRQLTLITKEIGELEDRDVKGVDSVAEENVTGIIDTTFDPGDI